MKDKIIDSEMNTKKVYARKEEMSDMTKKIYFWDYPAILFCTLTSPRNWFKMVEKYSQNLLNFNQECL